jgi:hypothetical protein
MDDDGWKNKQKSRKKESKVFSQHDIEPYLIVLLLKEYFNKKLVKNIKQPRHTDLSRSKYSERIWSSRKRN